MNARPLLFAITSALLIADAAGCERASVAAPTAPKQEQPIAPVPAAPPGSATIYALVHNSNVRYSVFEDGSFQLQYGTWQAYAGAYQRADSTITFDFARAVAHSWCSEPWCMSFLAVADVRGDTLFVRYDAGSSWLLCNDMMDDEVCNTSRATYVRSQ